MGANLSAAAPRGRACAGAGASISHLARCGPHPPARRWRAGAAPLVPRRLAARGGASPAAGWLLARGRPRGARRGRRRASPGRARGGAGRPPGPPAPPPGCAPGPTGTRPAPGAGAVSRARQVRKARVAAAASAVPTRAPSQLGTAGHRCPGPVGGAGHPHAPGESRVGTPGGGRDARSPSPRAPRWAAGGRAHPAAAESLPSPEGHGEWAVG